MANQSTLRGRYHNVVLTEDTYEVVSKHAHACCRVCVELSGGELAVGPELCTCMCMCGYVYVFTRYLHAHTYVTVSFMYVCVRICICVYTHTYVIVSWQPLPSW